MKTQSKTSAALKSLALVFLFLGAAFALRLWGRSVPLPPIPRVDASNTRTAPTRVSYAKLAEAKADLSDFDCSACHERNKPPTLRFDEQHNLIIPKEHSDIVM